MLSDGLNFLARKTHGFGKREHTWDGALVLCLFENNWLLFHWALGEPADDLSNGRRYRHKSPAMAIGLTEHVWSWEELLKYRHHHYSKV